MKARLPDGKRQESNQHDPLNKRKTNTCLYTRGVFSPQRKEGENFPSHFLAFHVIGISLPCVGHFSFRIKKKMVIWMMGL